MASAKESIRLKDPTPSALSTGIQYENDESNFSSRARKSDVSSLECIYALAALSESFRRKLKSHRNGINDVQAIPVEQEGVIPIVSSSDGTTSRTPQRVNVKSRLNFIPDSSIKLDFTDRFSIESGHCPYVDTKESFLASQLIVRILPLSRYHLSPEQRDATNLVNIRTDIKFQGPSANLNVTSISAEHTDVRSDCSIEKSTAHIEMPSEHLLGEVEDTLCKPDDDFIRNG